MRHTVRPHAHTASTSGPDPHPASCRAVPTPCTTPWMCAAAAPHGAAHFIKDYVPDALELELAPLECELAHAAWRADEHLRPLLLDLLQLAVGVGTAHDAARAQWRAGECGLGHT